MRVVVPKGAAGKESGMRAVMSAVIAACAAVGTLALGADAPRLAGEVYPSLEIGLLSRAVLKDLGPDVLATVGDRKLTREYLARKMAEVPEEARADFEKAKPFLLAQLLQRELLVAEAGNRGVLKKEDAGDEKAENEAIREMMMKIVEDVRPTEKEIEKAYEDNKEVLGDADLEKVKPMLREYLRREKQQMAVVEFMEKVAEGVAVSLDSTWAKEQDAILLDNPIDKARGSGKVTMVEFASEQCPPCKELKPVIEAIRKEQKDVNVIVIDVAEEQVLSLRYRVRGTPTVVFFDAAGKEVSRTEGLVTKEDIVASLDEARKGAPAEPEE